MKSSQPDQTITPGRYAAIDIGTVTCRMLIADVSINAEQIVELATVSKQYVITNLGEGVDATRTLSSEALLRVMSAIDGFLRIRDEFDTPENPVLDTMVMATSASRDASNADEFAALMAKRGLELSVIPGKMEAELSFIGASSPYAGETVIVVDTGGGSTEVAIGEAGMSPAFSHSFDIGCRRATERFWDGYPPSAQAVENARNWIRPQFNRWFADLRNDNPALKVDRMLAVAGTATSVVSIQKQMVTYDSDVVNGALVTLPELNGVLNRLLAMDSFELENVIGLDPKRGSVIAAGMVILEEVMDAVGVDAYTASESDILDGMIMYNAKHYKRS